MTSQLLASFPRHSISARLSGHYHRYQWSLLTGELLVAGIQRTRRSSDEMSPYWAEISEFPTGLSKA